MLLLFGKTVSLLHTSTLVWKHTNLPSIESLLGLIPANSIPRRCLTTAEEPIGGGCQRPSGGAVLSDFPFSLFLATLPEPFILKDPLKVKLGALTEVSTFSTSRMTCSGRSRSR